MYALENGIADLINVYQGMIYTYTINDTNNSILKEERYTKIHGSFDKMKYFGVIVTGYRYHL